MKIYILKREQRLKINVETAWQFFSNPKNLPLITPSWLNFRIMAELPEAIYPGLIITYKVKPLLGIPVTWVTEITHVRDKEFFVDEQRFGPYRFWHHQHLFIEEKNGILMTDIVHYAVPMGIFSSGLVNKKLTEVFNYRNKVLEEMF